MSNNDYILDAVKGEPNSLTSIAFHTGAIAERARIIKILKLELAGNDHMLEQLIYLINDRNVL